VSQVPPLSLAVHLAATMLSAQWCTPGLQSHKPFVLVKVTLLFLASVSLHVLFLLPNMSFVCLIVFYLSLKTSSNVTSSRKSSGSSHPVHTSVTVLPTRLQPHKIYYGFSVASATCKEPGTHSRGSGNDKRGYVWSSDSEKVYE
jgi:hypothetical protein